MVCTTSCLIPLAPLCVELSLVVCPEQDWQQRHQGQVPTDGGAQICGAPNGAFQGEALCKLHLLLSLNIRAPSNSYVQVCEKEMKVKAFSKEGLQAPQKDNPQERAKSEMRDKLNGQVEQLETQVSVWPCIVGCFQSQTFCKLEHGAP